MVENFSDRKVFYSEGVQVYFHKYIGKSIFFRWSGKYSFEGRKWYNPQKKRILHIIILLSHMADFMDIYIQHLLRHFNLWNVLLVIYYTFNWWYIYIPDAGTIKFAKHWFGMYIYKWFWYENYIYMGGWHECIFKKDSHHPNDKQGKV